MMKKYKPLIIVVGVVLLIGLLYFVFFTEAASDNVNNSNSNESSVTNQTSTPADGEPTSQVNAEAKGYYVTYADYQSNPGIYNDGKIIYFFNASWCPTCKALDSDIQQNSANIPTGVAVVSVDYDDNTDLRRQYGVTTQHTLVQVDAEGGQIKKWSGGNTLDSVLQQI